jgi:hypothetical protein
MIETLTQTKQIRSRIKDILAKSSGRRVAVVAFIGGDVHKFVPEPEGLEVYCWPNVVATNPDGIEWLINNHATVYFANNLHMKAYWSEKAGFLIGSCNLSSNALDDEQTGLIEIGVYSDKSTELNIRKLLRQLHLAGAKLVTQPLLDDFAMRCHPSSYRADGKRKHFGSHAPSNTFDEHLSAIIRPRLRVVLWGEVGPSSAAELDAAQDAVEEETGSRSALTHPIFDSIEVSSKVSAKEWILAMRRRRDNSIGKIAWLFPHRVIDYLVTSMTSPCNFALCLFGRSPSV